MSSTDQVTASSFTDELESEWPIVLNCSYSMCKLAIDTHDVENHTPFGMEMEFSTNADLSNFDYEDVDTCEADLIDF